jgi:hypothetical protein
MVGARARAILIVVAAAVTTAPPVASASFIELGQTEFSGSVCVAGSTWVQTASSPFSASYVVPEDGVITAWRTAANDNDGPLKLKVFRPEGPPGTYRTVGESAAETLRPSAGNAFVTNIPVRAGDVLGLTNVGEASCLVPTSRAADVVDNQADSDPAPGTLFAPDDPVPNRVLNVGATVEPDRDGDGVVDRADNCPDLANTDQANSEGAGGGDACDGDDDDDGVPDAADACPKVAAPSGDCPGDGTRPRLEVSGVPRSVKLVRFRRRGVRALVDADEPVALDLRLLATARNATATAAARFNLVLAERSLGFADGRRAVRLKPDRRVLRRARRVRVRLRIVATDRGGNRAVANRTIRVR